MNYRHARTTLLRMCLVLGLGAAFLAACKDSPPPGMTYWETDTFNIMVPRVNGWVLDTSLIPLDTAHTGGTIMRLQRNGAVAGSPRLDVVVEPPQPHPAVVEEFLTRNLQAMGALEAKKDIHIDRVEQRHIYVGSHPAYRVHHEYTVGTGSSQVAINQVSNFLVVEGRGVAVTAAVDWSCFIRLQSPSRPCSMVQKLPETPSLHPPMPSQWTLARSATSADIDAAATHDATV